MKGTEIAKELEHVDLLLKTSERILKRISKSTNPIKNYILKIDELRCSIREDINRLTKVR
jgi:hypothetical protein